MCGLTFLIAIAISVDARRRLLALRWRTGLALVVVLSAPWFVYMYGRFGRAFVDGYFLDENIRLFAASRFGNQPGVWFYFQILAAGLLPWTGLLAGRLVDDVKAAWRGERLDTRRDHALGMDGGRRRILHALDVQARSLRLPGRAGSVSPVRARMGRCADARTRPAPCAARGSACI